MSRERIKAAHDRMEVVYHDWQEFFWERAKEAGALLYEVDPQTRRPLAQFIRLEIYMRQGRKCPLCGDRLAREDIHEDHIIPISFGGANERSNIQLAHAICNLRRGNDMECVDLIQFIQYIEDRVRNLRLPQ